MLPDKQTYWITFDVVFNPRNPNTDVFKYNTFTAVISNDDFKKVSERKYYMINACKEKLVKWHKDHKFKVEHSKKEYADDLLSFSDGKVTCTFKNFIAKRADLDIL